MIDSIGSIASGSELVPKIAGAAMFGLESGIPALLLVELRSAMRPLTVTHTIAAPRERVFDYLSDVANYSEFCGHFLSELRLERLDSRGEGAALRFRLDFPLGRQWGDLVLTGLERSHRIGAQGRMGRAGRIELEAVLTLTTVASGMTAVELRFATSPRNHVDRFREALGLRPWMSTQLRRALRRLAVVIESGRSSTKPVGTAAG